MDRYNTNILCICGGDFAGLGKRMKPITLKIPKPLIQIGSKKLLERAIE